MSLVGIKPRTSRFRDQCFTTRQPHSQFIIMAEDYIHDKNFVENRVINNITVYVNISYSLIGV